MKALKIPKSLDRNRVLYALNSALLEAFELLGGDLLRRYLDLSLKALETRKGLDNCRTVDECFQLMHQFSDIIGERSQLVEKGVLYAQRKARVA